MYFSAFQEAALTEVQKKCFHGVIFFFFFPSKWHGVREVRENDYNDQP